MLSSILIKNFILIKEAKIDLSDGFTVITGETGSGKSMILDAIIFCLGQKFKSNILGKNNDFCSVTLEFENVNQELLNKLIDANIDVSDSDTIIITRWQNNLGKSKYSINNQLVNSKIINDISEDLITIYGQHSYSNLLNQSKHIKILDEYAGIESRISEIYKIYKKYHDIKNELEIIKEKENEIVKEIEYLEFLINEIENLNIKQGEESELAEKRLNFQKNQKYINVIKDSLQEFETSNIFSILFNVQKSLNKINDDERFSDIIKKLENAEVAIDEAYSEIKNIKNSIDVFDDINDIEERLFFIKDICRKYKVQSDMLGDFLENSRKELEKLRNLNVNKSNLEKKLEILKNDYFDLSENISIERKKYASLLENNISEELITLKMQGCRFLVDVIKDNFYTEDRKEIPSNSSTGLDKVSFLASTNLGMPFDSINKIASGGELSRFMLAIQLSLFKKNNNHDNIKNTIIFDEVDTGIGGAVADAVGDKLKNISEFANIIVITHQPQVAVKSDIHFVVEKFSDSGNTYSVIKKLSFEEKKKEIARMISGKEITEKAIDAATEMMKK